MRASGRAPRFAWRKGCGAVRDVTEAGPFVTLQRRDGRPGGLTWLGVTRRRLVATDTGFFIRGSGSQKRESRSTPACVGVRAALSALSSRQVSERKVVAEREGHLAGPTLEPNKVYSLSLGRAEGQRISIALATRRRRPPGSLAPRARGAPTVT
ncbi:hypothetical protein MRX96_001163 [Rhipicephalus microplus]